MNNIKQSSFEHDFEVIRLLDSNNLTEASEDESMVRQNGGTGVVGDTSNFVLVGHTATHSLDGEQQQDHTGVDATDFIVLRTIGDSNAQHDHDSSSREIPFKLSTWLVQDKSTQKRFNARQMRFETADDLIAASQIFLEWRELQHDNLVPVQHVYIDDRNAFIVRQRYADVLTEYIKTRAGKSEPDNFEEEEVLSIMKTIVDVFVYLHSFGFIHAVGQVSSDQVFVVNWSYSDFLIDFGKSFNIVNSKYYKIKKDQLLKNPYVSPDNKKLLNNNQFDLKAGEKSDVFSLGVIFFCIATLQTDVSDIFSGSSYLDRVKKSLSSSTLSKRSKNMLLKMLHSSADKRPSLSDITRFMRQGEDSDKAQDNGNISKRNSKVGTREQTKQSLFGKIISKITKKPDPIIMIENKSKKITKAEVKDAEAYILFRGQSLMEGQMRKTTNNGMTWQTRYWYLTDYNYLYSCEHTKDPWSVKEKVKLIPGNYLLNDTVSVKGSKGQDCFKLVTEDVKYIFSVESSQAKDKWVQALKNLVSNNPRPVPDSVDLSQELETDTVLEASHDHELLKFLDRLQELTTIKNMKVISYENVTIVERIGLDGLGIVYCVNAYDPVNKVTSKISMKELEEQNMTDGEFSEFLNEVNIMASLDHRNILKFKGVCYERDRLCLFSEYASLGVLETALQKQVVDFKKRVDILLQIATAMNHLHTREPLAIIHRDLKPENILCDRDYTIKITDFGFSRIRNKTMGKTQKARNNFKYMAPEKFGISEKNPQVEMAGDVFSFAMIAYEIITGQKVLAHAKYPIAIVNSITSGERPEFPSLDTLKDIIPVTDQDIQAYTKLQTVLQQCWDAEPDVRPTFATISQEIQNIWSV